MMRLPSFILSLVLATNLLSGQDKSAEPKVENLEAVIIPVKTLSGDSFNRLAKMLGVFNVKYVADDKLRTIIVYAPKDVVAQMRRVVEELDRPGSEAAIGRNIDMTLAFLLCSTKTPTTARAMPADLEPVARQLRTATQYKDIVVLEVLPIRAQEGKDTEQSSQLPGLPVKVPGQIATVQLLIRPEAIIRKETDRYVRFDRISIRFRIPYVTGAFKGPDHAPVSTQFQFMDAGVNTSGDFKEGQKTVLGKVSGIDEESALFIVISLKVLD